MRKKETVKFFRSVEIKKILTRIIYFILAFAILYNIIFIVHKSITQKEYLQLFGISFFHMDENLMEQDVNENDLVIVKKTNEKEIKIGDIIAYNVNGKIRINKVFNLYYDDNIRKVVYITKSNKNLQPDIETIPVNQIIGKKIINIPMIGELIRILQTKLATIIIFLILVICYFYNYYSYHREEVRKRKKMETMKDRLK